MRKLSLGMTVPEVLFAIILLTITFFSLLSVLASGLRTDKKGYIRDTASATADLLLDRTLRELRADSPPGTKMTFFNTEKPDRALAYAQGVESSGDTVYGYEICTTLVRHPDGTVFNAPNRRLVQVDVYVHWGDQDARTGYGSTLYHDRRMVSESSGDAI
jgi:hypothetical protein